MRLVKLIAPEGLRYSFRDNAGTLYAVGEKGEIDVPEHMVRDLLAEGFRRAAASDVVLMQGPRGEPGIDGKQGEVGPRGPTGPRGPIGPMPRHRWEGTALQFEMEPGQWGAQVDLRGPKGEPGRDGGDGGGFGAGPIDLSKLGVLSGSSYFPSGW